MVHVPLMFLLEWREFPSALCFAGEKKLDDSSCRNVVGLTRIAWHATFQYLLQEKICNPAHEQTPLSNYTIDSVIWHREIGRAKDLSAHSRNFFFCQVPMVFRTAVFESVSLSAFFSFNLWSLHYTADMLICTARRSFWRCAKETTKNKTRRLFRQ